MWYALKCRSGQEDTIIRSCRQRLSREVLDGAFVFRCERLWRRGGAWEPVVREMFPGYVFLESRMPEKLSRELEPYRSILRVMEERGGLLPVYPAEEAHLRKLCGESHFLAMSYGYRDDGCDHITSGPLRELQERILRADWHRRFAQVRFTVMGKPAVVWAGLGLDQEAIKRSRETALSG